jgi:hypothetical protein
MTSRWAAAACLLAGWCRAVKYVCVLAVGLPEVQLQGWVQWLDMCVWHALLMAPMVVPVAT